MKTTLALCFLSFAASFCEAEILPYERWETTGLMDNVRISPSKLANVIFTDASVPETKYILEKLLEAGIFGITTDRELSITGWQQKIFIEGELGKKEKKTGFLIFGDPEPYRDFTLLKLKVRFPLYTWDQTTDSDQPTLKIYKTIFDLFPAGLQFDGKPIDLRKYVERTMRSCESR